MKKTGDFSLDFFNSNSQMSDSSKNKLSNGLRKKKRKSSTKKKNVTQQNFFDHSGSFTKKRKASVKRRRTIAMPRPQTSMLIGRDPNSSSNLQSSMNQLA